MFTVIEKTCTGNGYGYDRYRIVVQGDLSDYDGKTRKTLIDMCDINNWSGHIELAIYNKTTDTTTFIIKVYID